jgi:coproporphyrinogen III oxidase-like Fe-S oxidoreductase
VLKALEVDQVSFYPLMPATTTRRTMAAQMGAVTFRREKAFYREILAEMSEAYQLSSAWCFSRGTGMIDEYIVDYDEYLGVGSGSFSYLGGSIYSSTFSIARYLQRVESGRTGITLSRQFEPIERMRYDFLMKLFGLSMDVAAMEKKYGGEFRRRLWKEFLFFRAVGALKESEGRYLLTSRGMYYWVIMMREFLMGVNTFREDMRQHIRAEFSVEIEDLKRTVPKAGTG